MKKLKNIDELNLNTVYYIDSKLGGYFKLRYKPYDEKSKKYYFKNTSPDWEKMDYFLLKNQVLKKILIK